MTLCLFILVDFQLDATQIKVLKFKMIYEIDPTAPTSHMKYCALLHDDLLAYIGRYIDIFMLC